MTHSIHRIFAVVAVAVLAACSANGAAPGIPATAQGPSLAAPAIGEAAINGRDAPPAPGPWALKRLCPQTADPSRPRCLAIRRTDLFQADVATDSLPNVGFGPADLRSAYGLTSLSVANGHSQTIAIVDAYDDPKAESDMAVYRSTYGLPACSSASGCFRKVNQKGQASPLPPGDQGWGGEESLDLDMASAICPNCHIILVEINSSFDAGVNAAVALGANVISNSYGGPEGGRTDAAYDHPGVVITASSGDGSYYDCDASPRCTGPEQPASYANVVAVGGTALVRTNSGRGWTEKVWENGYGGTGSGCSRVVAKPSWQTDHGCTMRSETDISSVADPNTPVAVYDTYAPAGQQGWGGYGGTSASSPTIAGVFALAGNGRTVAQPEGLWRNAGRNTNDVTTGDNISPWSKAKTCPSTWRYICYAGTGYDGPTGWGTPNGIAAF